MDQEFIKRLLAQRANTWEQAKALLDHAASEDRDLSVEEQVTYDRMNADLDSVSERVKDMEAAEQRSKDTQDAFERLLEQPIVTPNPLQTSVVSDEDMLRQMVRGERRSLEFRDLTKLTAGAGGNTVPTNFYATLQEHMIQNAVIRQSNVNVITTDGGQALQVPKTTTHPTATIIAEAASITESDAVFGQVTLDAFKYAFTTQVSSELEADTGVNLAEYLARIGGEALGNGSGVHFMTGTGTGQPNGIVTASTLGITGAAATAGAFTADNLIDLYYSVIAPYRDKGSWLMRDSSLAAARKLKETTGQYLWAPGLAAGETSTLLGAPVLSSPNVVGAAALAKSVVFGDMSRYTIRDVKGVRVERSSDFAFQNDLVTWRFILRTDGDLIDTTGAIKHFAGGAAV